MIPMNIKKMVGETFLLHQFVLLVNHKRKWKLQGDNQSWHCYLDTLKNNNKHKICFF
jgi:hypothetical protein